LEKITSEFIFLSTAEPPPVIILTLHPVVMSKIGLMVTPELEVPIAQYLMSAIAVVKLTVVEPAAASVKDDTL
jgi:hypothetical protein